ncbi:MAG: hypothetical protein KDD11_14895 [Acidobacteria bacterium]|nr:hypothetical protein [Acidobacteriota bacterium]
MRYPTILALACAITVSSTAARAEEPAAVLDRDGRLYQLQSGTYGELFTDGTLAAATAPVLALDIHDPDGTEHRLLVAGTEDSAREMAGQLVLEETSQTLYVVWERLPAKGAEEVLAVGLEGQEWSDPVTLTAEAEITATPQLRVTRDSFLVDDGKGGAKEVVRTALHLLWAEQSEGGEAVIYAPVILEDGVNRSPAPRVVLNDFGTGGSAPEVLPEGLGSSPTLVRGSDDHSVVAGFVDVSTGRQLTIELRMMPYALGGLAREVERYILDEGSLAQTPSGFESLAGGVGGMIIETGSRLFGTDGLDRTYVSSRLSMIDVPRSEGGEEVAPHMVRVYVTSDRPAPTVGAGVEASLLVSGDGERGVVCWENGSSMLYRETEGSGWTSVRTLPMGAGLDRDKAEELLRQRLQAH